MSNNNEQYAIEVVLTSGVQRKRKETARKRGASIGKKNAPSQSSSSDEAYEPSTSATEEVLSDEVGVVRKRIKRAIVRNNAHAAIEATAEHLEKLPDLVSDVEDNDEAHISEGKKEIGETPPLSPITVDEEDNEESIAALYVSNVNTLLQQRLDLESEMTDILNRAWRCVFRHEQSALIRLINFASIPVRNFFEVGDGQQVQRYYRIAIDNWMAEAHEMLDLMFNFVISYVAKEDSRRRALTYVEFHHEWHTMSFALEEQTKTCLDILAHWCKLSELAAFFFVKNIY